MPATPSLAGLNNSVYFLSDRSGTMNLFQWDHASRQVEQLTFHDDFDIRSLSTGAGLLTYEQAGKLHIFNPVSRKTTSLSISNYC